MKAALLALSAALSLSACVDDYYGYDFDDGYRSYYGSYYGRGPAYYDGYYGPLWGGYWGRDNFYYYAPRRGGPYLRDDGRHFRRDWSRGYYDVRRHRDWSRGDRSRDGDRHPWRR